MSDSLFHPRENTVSNPREYRLAPKYLRSTWYVLGGAVVLGGLAIELWRLGLVAPGVAPIRMFSMVVLLLVGAVLLVGSAHSWRIRVDDSGVARRRWFVWDAWKWDEWRSGQIRRCACQFTAPARPWWRRHLDFDLLSEPERNEVFATCRVHFRPTTPVFEPGSLTLSFLYFTITFRPTEVVGRDQHGEFHTNWDDVGEVRVWHFDDWSPEVVRIEVDLPERMIRVAGVRTARIGNRIFSASDTLAHHASLPDVVAPALNGLVPPGKLVRCSLRGPPATIGERERRRTELRRQLRNWTMVKWLVSPLSVVVTAVAFVPKIMLEQGQPGLSPVWVWLATIALCLSIVVPGFLMWAVAYACANWCSGQLEELRRREAA